MSDPEKQQPSPPVPPSQTAVDLAVAAIPIVLFAAVSAMRRPASSMVIFAVCAAIACGLTLARAATRGRLTAAIESLKVVLQSREAWLVAAVLLAHAVCKLPFVGLVPRWDSGQYAVMLFTAMDTYSGTLASFFSDFRFAGHPSHAMGLYWAIGQFIAPFGYSIINAQNLLLSLFAIGCFAWLVRALFPTHAMLDRILLVASYAFQPLFFACGLGPNVDLGICSFLTFALAAYANARPGLFTMAGFYLCFSKETGFLLYGGLVVLAGVAHLLNRRPITPRDRGVAWLACLPLAAYLLFHFLAAPSSWTEKALDWNNASFLTFGYHTKTFFTVLAEGLVLNFLWIPTLFWLALGLLHLTGRRAGVSPTLVRIAAILFAGFLAVNCLYINYLNPRYLLGLVPLSLVLFGHALHAVVADARARLLVLSAFVLLSFGQVWVTIDPVSRLVFGTMDIGAGSLLAIDRGGQSIVDGQVYNAQFAGIARIYERLNSRIFRDGRRPIVLVGLNHAYAYYYNCCWVNDRTFRYTYHAERGFQPLLTAVEKLTPENAPASAVYAAMPWLEDTQKTLEQVERLYRVEDRFVLEKRGYRVTVYELARIEQPLNAE